MKLTRVLVALSIMIMVFGCSFFKININGYEIPIYKKNKHIIDVVIPEKVIIDSNNYYKNETVITFKNEKRMKFFYELVADFMRGDNWAKLDSEIPNVKEYDKRINPAVLYVSYAYKLTSEKVTKSSPDDSIFVSFSVNSPVSNKENQKLYEQTSNTFFNNLKNYIANHHLFAQTKGFGFASSGERSAQTADEVLVYGKFGTKGLLALDLIDGVNTIDNIMNKSGMNKQEITDLFKFLIENDFVEI